MYGFTADVIFSLALRPCRLYTCPLCAWLAGDAAGASHEPSGGGGAGCAGHCCAVPGRGQHGVGGQAQASMRRVPGATGEQLCSAKV